MALRKEPGQRYASVEQFADDVRRHLSNRPVRARDGALAYRAPKGKAVTHVVLDAPATDGKATVTAVPEGDACAVTIAAGGTLSARPVIVMLDEACAVTADPEEPSGVSAEGKPAPVHKPRIRRGGCCRLQTTPGSPVAMSLVVLTVLWRRRRGTT